MDTLTSRQQEVLEFIFSFQQKHGRAPLASEIADHFGFSHHSSAYQHLRALENKGYLEIQQTGKRRVLRIRITRKAKRAVEPAYPLLGDIPAGPLSEVLNDDIQEIRELHDLVPDLRPGDFFVRVEGESMIEADLHPGDLVAFRPDKEVANGDICAVWIDGEGSTMKQVYHRDQKIQLVPANPDREQYPIQSYPPERVRIQGVLVASITVQAH